MAQVFVYHSKFCNPELIDVSFTKMSRRIKNICSLGYIQRMLSIILKNYRTSNFQNVFFLIYFLLLLQWVSKWWHLFVYCYTWCFVSERRKHCFYAQSLKVIYYVRVMFTLLCSQPVDIVSFDISCKLNNQLEKNNNSYELKLFEILVTKLNDNFLT